VKNLIVANFQPHGRVSGGELRTMVEAQIENSLALGWRKPDLVLVTNERLDSGVTEIVIDLQAHCMPGSKMFALEYLLQQGVPADGEVWWAHDLDAWQNYWFDEPEVGEIGLTEYSLPKFNGGSIFLKRSAGDLIHAITSTIRNGSLIKEEPAIDLVLRTSENLPRVTILNSTYNVGCSAYEWRYERSTKPILVSHFHPTNRTGWKVHVVGKNRIGRSSVSPRLQELLVRHFYRGVLPG
jgi:hypothetical protein